MVLMVLISPGKASFPHMQVNIPQLAPLTGSHSFRLTVSAVPKMLSRQSIELAKYMSTSQSGQLDTDPPDDTVFNVLGQFHN